MNDAFNLLLHNILLVQKGFDISEEIVSPLKL